MWRITLSIPNLFGSAILKLRRSAASFNPPFRGQPLCDYCERNENVLVSFVVKVSVHFRLIDCDIKLTNDALKELVVPNFL